MAIKQLPEKPNLGHYKKQAKDLVKAFRRGGDDFLRRVQTFHVKAMGLPIAEIAQLKFSVCDAQLVLAREHGFTSWTKFKQEIEAMTQANPESIDVLMPKFVNLLRDGEAEDVDTFLNDHPELEEHIDDPVMSFDSPPILFAVGRDERALARVLLKHGADVNAKSQWWAGGFGVLESARDDFLPELIERGAVVDVHAAAKLGDLNRLRELVEADPELVHARGGDGKLPLHYASTREGMAYLLDNGAEVDARDVDHESTAAQYAVGEDHEKVRYLIERGATPDIFMACMIGDLDVVKHVLADDSNVLRDRVNEGKFALKHSKGGHHYLYAKGLGYTARPLQVAADQGHQEVLDYLLEQSTENDRLLFYCTQADESAVQKMIQENTDLVKSLRKDEQSLLADMAWIYKTDAVRVMLDAGFDVNVKGVHDSAPLDRAAYRGFKDLVELILKYDPEVDVKNEFGGTPLTACIHGSLHMRDARGDYPGTVEVLIRAGAKLPEKLGGSEAVQAVLKRFGVSN